MSHKKFVGRKSPPVNEEHIKRIRIEQRLKKCTSSKNELLVTILKKKDYSCENVQRR